MLNEEEKKWLNSYRENLYDRFPDLVENILLYGSKARGDSRRDSDLDLLILIREGDRKLKKQVASIGIRPSIGTNVVPSIFVFTIKEWERLKLRKSVFCDRIQEEGISFA
jgi:predicted nucleotidyltransferase